MKNNFDFQRGFADIIINQTNDLEEVERGDKRLEIIAHTSVMKTVFCGVYETLVSSKELNGIEQQPVEYKQELWEMANKYLPGEPEAWKIKYCKAIMGFLWLMNN